MIADNRLFDPLTIGPSPPQLAEVLQLAFSTLYGGVRTFDGFIGTTQDFDTLQFLYVNFLTQF